MEKKISVQQILNELKTSQLLLNCLMPLGYVPGLPILQVRNDQLCLMIPYLRYKVTGVADKTQVYPIRFALTLVLPEKRMVEYKDLSVTAGFETVRYDTPVGYFRHEAIRDMNKAQYNAARAELFAEYDKVANALLYDAPYTEEDDAKMRSLLQKLCEPSLLPFYKALDGDFYNKYLA